MRVCSMFAACGTRSARAVSLLRGQLIRAETNMPGFCPSWWERDAGGCGLGYFWRTHDVIERGIFIALALMLAYTAYVAIRFSRRYHQIRSLCQSLSTENTEARRSKTQFLVDLSPSLGMLRGIMTAAPFLGLVGTCYGIAAGIFIGFGLERSLAERILMTNAARALIIAAYGILVVVPASLCHNFLRNGIEVLRVRPFSRETFTSFRRAQTLSLRKPFAGPPSFAFVAASALACIVTVFTPFHPYRAPTGVGVRLPGNRCDGVKWPTPDRAIMLKITNSGDLSINTEPVGWTELSNRLAAIYRNVEKHQLYLYPDDDVPFQTVADAIDIADNTSVPGPHSWDIQVILVTPKAAESISFPVRRGPHKRAPQQAQ